MNLHIINPIFDGRWKDLVARHPQASAFHQPEWLLALGRTYGYESFALTSASPNKPLSDGIVFCRVSSWITGNRAVSLPFSDHCEPLLNDTGESADFMTQLRIECDCQRWSYAELRPLSQIQASNYGWQVSQNYWFHELDIRPTLEQLFRGLHKDSVQRRIQRAEREGLSYEMGRSKELMNEFYRLLVITRRRHQLLPQPRCWFRNLVDCMGDRVQIRVARKDDIPISAMLTLRHGSSVIYKYGCSDERFHNLGGQPFLFWKLIEESKASEVQTIDFGRSDLDHEGLITFKEKFGTTRKLLTYYRYARSGENELSTDWEYPALRKLFSMMPDSILSTAGRVLYRHFG